jgi:asparagine synthase (glutamine-hydrolysing)
VCGTYLPREILRRSKRAFAGNVVDEWFSDEMDTRMTEILLDSESLMYRYLRPQTVQKLFKEHSTRHNNNYKILFSLVVLEEWLRSYVSCKQ